MNPSPARHDRRGLTLIELIASLTVFLIVMATLVVALNTSLDTWRRSRERTRQIVTGRAALDLIVDDLQHAVADQTNLFTLTIIPGTRQRRDTQANRAAFHRIAADPAASGLAAAGDVVWSVQPTDNLGSLVRDFSYASPLDDTDASNSVVLVEGVASLQFIPVGVAVSNTPPSELNATNLPPVIDVYLELLSPADGRRAQRLTPSAREAFIARRGVRIATRVAFAACHLPPQDKPATYRCSGRIIDGATEVGLAGAPVDLIGVTNLLTRLTDADGRYEFAVPSWWPVYTIQPRAPDSRSGAYDPQQRVCRLSQGTLDGQDFRWAPSDLVISGLVTRADTALGVAGVRVAFPNAGEAETGNDGSYAIGISQGWPYGGTVAARPSHPHGGTFNPVTRDYTAMQQSLAGQDYAWTPPMVVVSGFVTRAASSIGVVDAILTFSGINAPPPVRTVANGFYRQALPYEWTGLITPLFDADLAVGGYFTPPNASLVKLVRGARQDFEWTQWPIAVSGHVYYADSSVGVPGATIRFDSSGPAVTSLADGGYVGYVPFQWSGTATPSHSDDGVFAPLQRVYGTPLVASVADQDYRWFPYEFLITGHVTETGTGLPMTNATIRFVMQRGYAAASNVVVHVDGTYSNRVSAGWSGVTIPSSPLGGTFAPVTNAYSDVRSDQLGQDFTWTPAYVFVIAGRVTETNILQAVTNASVRFATSRGYAAATNVFVNTNGAYTNRVSFGWSGVTTPWSPLGGTFAPTNYPYTNVTNDWPAQNFQRKQ